MIPSYWTLDRLVRHDDESTYSGDWTRVVLWDDYVKAVPCSGGPGWSELPTPGGGGGGPVYGGETYQQ